MSKHDNPLHMETKSRSETDPAHPLYAEMTCGVHGSQEYYNVQFWIDEFNRRYEIYTPNSSKFHGGRSWKSFEHYKCENGPMPAKQQTLLHHCTYWDYPSHYGTTVIEDPLFGYYQEWNGFTVAPFGIAGSPDQGLPAFVEYRPDGGFIPPPGDIDGLVSRALRSMLPSIKSELSIINSLIELKDFKRPIRSILQYFKGNSALSKVSASLKYVRSLRNKTLREVFQTAAGGYLQARFNFLPLISDIRAVYTALSRTERRINDLITRSGRKQNKHWMFRWQEYPDTYEIGNEGWPVASWAYIPNPRINSIRKCTYSPTVFHAQIQYNYNYTEYQLAHAQVLAHLDALGVNFNPAIIWNAIPWSFVVDWVIGVSRWLDSFKVENMKPKINICNFCWSIKRERVIQIEKGISSDPIAGYKSRSTLPLTYQTAYRRSVGIPSVSSLTTSGVSSDEFTLGAALVIAQRRRRTRR